MTTPTASKSALQVAALCGEPGQALTERLRREREEAQTAPATSSVRPPARLVDETYDTGGDFWSHAANGDRALTAVVTAAATDEQRARATQQMIDDYEVAFRTRSTWAERASVIDHVADIRDLLGTTDPRHANLDRAWDALKRWNSFSVAETAPPTAVAASAETVVRGTAGITLTAFPAARGDCLAVDYPGTDGERHVLLIDGGLGSTYEQGLQSCWSMAPGSHA